MKEIEYARMEAEIIDRSDSYFKARPSLDTVENRKLFEDGLERGFKFTQKVIGQLNSAQMNAINMITPIGANLSEFEPSKLIG